MTRTVVALYDNFDTALNVVEDLVEAGLPSESISFAANDSVDKYSQYLSDNGVQAINTGNVTAGEGAGFGAVVGSLVGLGLAVIPGIGQVIAAGPLVSAVIGAAAGAVTGGIVAGLVDLGIPESEANIYAEGVRRGGVLLIVKAEDHWAEAAVDIMERYKPINIENQLQDWRQEGWAKFDNSASPYIQAEGTVEKKAEMNEGKAGMWQTDVRSYSDLDADFRQHYQENYAQNGYDYEYYYLPAYRYGYTLATEGRFVDYTWEDLEPEARRRWEVRHDGPWDNFKDAVRYAWEKMRYGNIGEFPQDQGTSA